MERIRELFEEWIPKQFPGIKVSLKDFHSEDGYADQTANAIWIGFNAGIELYPLV